MNELKKMSAKCNIRINKYKKDFFEIVQNVIVFLVLLEEPCAVKAACTVLGRVWRL